jgi:protein ImuB
MPLAEARAREPLLCVHDYDPASAGRALKKLATWAERYSPLVGLEEDPAPQCLLLDITGCAGCFHGEDQLAQQVVREFRTQGLRTHAAIADTLGAAWGIAHYIDGFIVVPAGETERAVQPLPPAALRLPEKVLQSLAELGIDRIGRLMDLPRGSLPGRFGPAVVQRLDQLLGRVPELIVPCRSRPDPQVRWSFEYPTDRREFVRHALDQLLEQLVRILDAYHRGARHLECWLLHEAAEPLRIDVRLFRPTRSSAHLGKLLRERLEHVRLAEPVSSICLRAGVVEKIPERPLQLFAAEESGADELAPLIDRLAGRLGREAVTFPHLVPDPQPEYACRFEPAIPAGPKRCQEPFSAQASLQALFSHTPKKVPDAFHEPQPPFHRPVQVWPVPEPIDVATLAPEGTPARFRRLGKEHAVLRSWGPERIETGWWRGRDIQRDYYTVETSWGTRWWLFRRHEDDRWFLHGCFD